MALRQTVGEKRVNGSILFTMLLILINFECMRVRIKYTQGKSRSSLFSYDK